MHYEPVANLALDDREDVAAALCAMLTPMEGMLSPGAARLRLSYAGADSEVPAQELEALTRMVWGLAPFVAGGGDHSMAQRLLEGLQSGTDPSHPEYWGVVRAPCIRAVEMAPLGLMLALCPDTFWRDLPSGCRQNFYTWLDQINHIGLHPNNWLFFRVLVNLGFAAVGQPTAAAKVEEDLSRLESWYLGDGWYGDGAGKSRDYYIAFAMHFYGLIYAALAAHEDPKRASRLRERAAAFAPDYMHWFGEGGASFPYGRSLTYRFAVASFWGALAFAGVEALPWGVIKGLYLRNLRWWFRRPVFTETGLLTLGYGYPNLNLPEAYSSPGSPYWAFKAFLPLALPASHPFWAAQEEPLPQMDEVRPLKHASMVICRDRPTGHVVALAGGQLAARQPSHMRSGPAKYAKFAYSNAFGFSLPLENDDLARGAYDSMLALSCDGEYYRVRGATCDESVEGGIHSSRWNVFGDVDVETHLIPAGPWHVRVHRVTTPRPLHFAEGGFALGRTDETMRPAETTRCEEEGSAFIHNAKGLSGICGLCGPGKSCLIDAAPNSNLIEPMTCIPMLVGELEAGAHILACAVLGLPGPGEHMAAWKRPPVVDVSGSQVTITDADGKRLFAG